MTFRWRLSAHLAALIWNLIAASALLAFASDPHPAGDSDAARNAPLNESWRIVGPWGGTATSIAVDPKDSSVLLAGGRNSLLFRSDDSGEQWRILHFPKRQFGEVSAILIDPNNTRHYFVGLGGSDRGGLFESVDAGSTWTAVENLKEVGVRALALAPSQPGTFAAATVTGIYRTVNFGKTWQLISDPNNLEMRATTTVAFDPQHAEIIYAGTAHLPWKTTDGGKTWESIHQGMIDDSDVFSIHIRTKTCFRQRVLGHLRQLKSRRFLAQVDGHPQHAPPDSHHSPGSCSPVHYLCRNHARPFPLG